MAPLERELSVAVAAARAAGSIIRSYYEGGVAVREKGEGDPVTDADIEANDCIRRILHDGFPADGWLSEESVDSEERFACQRVWVVDPLDGTREFVQKIPEFTVCVGLVAAGKPRLGVCYNPATEELFSGVVGEGARYNDKPARVSSVGDLRGARVLASRSEAGRGEWDAYEGRLQIVLTGSVAYKLALIAAGKGDATFSLSPKNEWDICAGVALILAAGGQVTDRAGGELRFNQRQTLLSGLIASNGRLHGALEALVRETTPSSRG